MAMAGMFETCSEVNENQVRRGLTGNLCRCTGYEPIIKAALAVDGNAGTKMRDRYPSLPDAGDSVRVRHFFAPATLDEAIAFKRENAGCTIVQGGTDVGVWINKRNYSAPAMLSLAKIDALNGLREDNGVIVAGANVTLSDFFAFIEDRIPKLAAILSIFGSPQIRNAGTLIGNIANGSPIGDLPPALIALGATLGLQRGDRPRTLPLENYFVDYGKQDRMAGEFVRVVRIPKFGEGEHFRCYKISKRFDSDISAVMGAFKLRLDGTRIAGARIAFGGMAAIPKRARTAEKALIETYLDQPKTLEEAIDALAQDFSPIDDLRASAKYRLDAARALLRRALSEIGGASTRKTRLVGFREAADVDSA
jgi:xanthine dehydrogenase small subunit